MFVLKKLFCVLTVGKYVNLKVINGIELNAPTHTQHMYTQ